MDIVDPTNQQLIDYPTFRTKIRQALNASIRTARTATNFAMGVELIAVLVAVVNFVYVILLTSEFQADWFDAVTVSAGSAITILGLLELVIRFNPLRIPNFASITRLNPTFDGLALLGALVSCIGTFCSVLIFILRSHVIQRVQKKNTISLILFMFCYFKILPSFLYHPPTNRNRPLRRRLRYCRQLHSDGSRY